MTLGALLRHPQATIPELVRSEESITVPVIAYACLSFAEGVDRIAEAFPRWHGAVVVLVTMSGAIVIGSWSWALVFGGLAHAGARIVGGREGWMDTVRAIGYALFWPGVIGAIAAALATYLDRSGGPVRELAYVPMLVQVVAGFWGLYTTIAAIRSWHAFGWWRAIFSYLLGILILLVPITIIALLL